jgi:predicted dehydrogenase
VDGLSRRDTLRTTGLVAAAGALTGIAIPSVHADGGGELQVALVGCGGRGTGAATQALSTVGPTKLIAMADVFEDKLNNSHDTIKKEKGSQVDVPQERRFVGFDGYAKAFDCLKKGDIVILATPPGFRHIMFEKAIQKGLHVFMEKPVTVDGPQSRKMFALNEEAKKKNLKVAVGLMCRHCKARQELYRRIKEGQIGDLTMLRAYRQAGPTASAFSTRTPKGMSEVMYQISRFHSFLWASGGAYSDFLIHNVDEACWMKDAWPVEAKASGGRHYRGDYVDQNFDNYSVEYTFEDGTKFFLEGRTMDGCTTEFATYVHGTKGSAVVSQTGHWPSRAKLLRTQNVKSRKKEDIIWQTPAEKSPDNPYQVEWHDFVDAIRNDKPYNEADRGIKASLVTSMGRLAAHTGQIITYQQMLNHDHEFAPNIAKMTKDGPAPVMPDKDGKYPIPKPGILKNREYDDPNAPKKSPA